MAIASVRICVIPSKTSPVTTDKSSPRYARHPIVVPVAITRKKITYLAQRNKNRRNLRVNERRASVATAPTPIQKIVSFISAPHHCYRLTLAAKVFSFFITSSDSVRVKLTPTHNLRIFLQQPRTNPPDLMGRARCRFLKPITSNIYFHHEKNQ